MTGDIADKDAFIRLNTRLRAVPLAPEIVLYVADEAVPLWHKTEEELGEAGLPPPFWAFAWAGGQALARHILDHPELVRGKTVLDLASGSGLVGIAAMKAGAASVTVADIDAFACAAAMLNAAQNDVMLTTCQDDLMAEAHGSPWDVILTGDIFYERDTAQRAFSFLEAHAARGTAVLIGDPGRTTCPRDKLRRIADYSVPVTRDLEDTEIKQTAVWALLQSERPNPAAHSAVRHQQADKSAIRPGLSSRLAKAHNGRNQEHARAHVVTRDAGVEE